MGGGGVGGERSKNCSKGEFLSAVHSKLKVIDFPSVLL